MKNLMISAILFVVCNTIYAQNKTSLTALFDTKTKTVKLRWQNLADALSYSLQSSKDNHNFTDIFTPKSVEFKTGDFIKYNDYQAAESKNYYRLKIYKSNSIVEIQPPVMLVTGSADKSWVIFPVPIGPVINLEYKGNDAIKGVIAVTIQSVTSGTIFTRLRLASTTRKITIPISNIGKGTYDVRIYVGDDIVWNQRVVKF